METTIEDLKHALAKLLPQSHVKVDEPEHNGGNYWVDVSMGKKRHTLEYSPGKGLWPLSRGCRIRRAPC